MEAADTSPPLPRRSPYERFRSRRGRLSVTDLVSGVWCEQQFMYTLETGFKRNTPAMRRGTRLHKVLEEEVHTTVPVTVKTKEDQWGLKLFNICQGLQSLAEYGMTRELEVFGWLNGIYISGVIDEITYDHPRPDKAKAEAGMEAIETPSDDESFTTCPDDIPKVVYITDTKTRMTPTVPRQSQQLSASLQLTFYHTLLASLPSVPFNDVLVHHNLSPTARFSDTFIAQVGSMQSTISLPDLLDNNSLPGMWSLVLSQYAKAIDSIGDTVGVTYRFQGNGEVIAERSWRVEEDVRERHLDDVMQWWKGERTTRGVAIEDAWKCGMCEFREGCTWRLGKLEETRRKAKDSFAANEKVGPKDKDEIDEDALKTVERVRRRGRKAAEETEASDSDTSKEEKPRRRRSKKKNEDIATTATSGEAILVVKRGRGRPKDENAAVTATTTLPLPQAKQHRW
ncbi:exonuclease V [Morchella snyderi]|nr:exonuclease V [Morchella snyderi]